MPYKETEMRKRFARGSMQRLRGERRYNQILRMLDTLKEVYGEETLRYLGPEQVCSFMRGLHFTEKDYDLIEELLRKEKEDDTRRSK